MVQYFKILVPVWSGRLGKQSYKKFQLHQAIGLLLILCMGLLLSACGTPASDEPDLRGHILLWHSWQGQEAEALDALLDKFSDIYPGIDVISTPYPHDELLSQFQDKVAQGLGPDILIGSQLWVPDLVNQKLIPQVEQELIQASTYFSSALSTLQYQGDLYGLPLSIQTSALYYNKQLVDTPPATLEALLEQAAEGKKVLLNTQFESAFWGIQAFGGQILDSEGRIVLNQGGFANWLNWLLDAQNVPNIILTNDGELLTDLFEKGEAAYYVGGSQELLHLQDVLGEEQLGVAPLPMGPNNSAGPFLVAEPLLFSTASSSAQTERALRLAEFLTNIEQQRKLAQLTGRIPSNPQVRIDRRITPAVAGFVEQSKTAVPRLLIPQMADAIAYGKEAYIQSLEGLTSPVDAANRLTKRVNDLYDLNTVEVATDTTCDSGGTVSIWHSWSGRDAAALSELGTNFASLCPGVSIALTAVDEETLLARYQTAVRADEGPDLILTSNKSMMTLVSNEVVRDMADLVDPNFLQRYIPRVPDVLRHRGGLYGLPLTMNTMAMYYNRSMVIAPPVDTGDLLSTVNPDRQAVIVYTPYEKAHWGLAAFGGKLFDVEGNMTLNEGGFAEWLRWLHVAYQHPGMTFTKDKAEAKSLFAKGQAAFLSGDRKLLNELQEKLGRIQVGVAPLPAGPEGASGPILTVDGFMLNPTLSSTQATLALEFAKYATTVASQTHLMQRANLIPANIHIDVTDFPAIAGFLEQAQTAVILPNQVEADTILGIGQSIYENVLFNGTAPEVVLDDFTAFMQGHSMNVTAQSCGNGGELTLWHSVQGTEDKVLTEIIADFARHCPDVMIRAEYIPADEFPNRLAASSVAISVTSTNPQSENIDESANVPDLILAPHDLIKPLSEERLIKPITPWVAGSTLIPYTPKALDALRYEASLYGLPYAISTSTLFYNTEMVSEPVESIEELFSVASPNTPLAIDTSFKGAFWGVRAFGQNVLSRNNLTSEPDPLNPEQAGLVEWMSWLQSVQGRPGIMMSEDSEKLQELFAAGNAAYLIANSDLLASLRNELESDESSQTDNTPPKVKVWPLPDGPKGHPSPFFTVKGFLFSAFTSEEQTQLALKFAEFATSSKGQTLLAEEAALAPANRLTMLTVDDPEINHLVVQIEQGVPVPPRAESMVLFEGGDALYTDVLENGQDPKQAVSQFKTYLDETPTPAVIAYAGEQVLACDGQGQLLFWHSWPFASPGTESESNQTNEQTPNNKTNGQELNKTEGMTQTGQANVLEQISADFANYCPGVQVKSVYVPAEELPDRLTTAVAENVVPDLFLARHDLIMPLWEQDLIKPVTPLVDSTFLEQYLPKSIVALEHEEQLYGIPQSMDVMALYYNTELVSTTVSTLDDLLSVASPDALVVLDASFYGAFWGVSAFGGQLFDTKRKLVLDQGGFLDWLAWLQSAQRHPGIVLSTDREEMLQLFAQGRAAYLVAGPDALSPLRKALGNQVRVVPLPTGPEGSAGPFLRIEAFLFSSAVSEEQTQLALTFAGFASSEVNQTLLRKEVNLVPTNRRAAEATDDSAIHNFIKQAQETSFVLPNAPEMAVLESGNSIYIEMLAEGLEPANAVARLMESVSSEQ